jgi:protein gp37
MQNTKIEWSHNTFNPWWGCTKVSPACDNCYAERLAKRKTRTDSDLWGKDAERYQSTDSYWEQPEQWNARAEKTGTRERVFCGSMCDVMERRPDLDAPRKRLFKLIEDTPYLDWLLLTKRPQEYSKLLPNEWLVNPRPNVWLMTTCESQDYIWRIYELLKVPAVVHGVSLEPMLSPIKLPVEFLRLGSASWVIVGGESGNLKSLRPTPVQWFRNIRDQCNTAHVAFFFKQWGEHLDLVKIGKAKAGRILDGREWDEFPTPADDAYTEHRERLLYLAQRDLATEDCKSVAFDGIADRSAKNLEAGDALVLEVCR